MPQTSTHTTAIDVLSKLNLQPGEARQYNLREKEGAQTPLNSSPIATYRPYAGPAILTILRSTDEPQGPRYYIALDATKGIHEDTSWKEGAVGDSTFMVPCEGRILASYVMIRSSSSSGFTGGTLEHVFDGGVEKIQNPVSDMALTAILRSLDTLEVVHGYHSPGAEGCGLSDALRRLGNALPMCDKQPHLSESDVTGSELPKTA